MPLKTAYQRPSLQERSIERPHNESNVKTSNAYEYRAYQRPSLQERSIERPTMKAM
jgi:hypothetical protein